ncbi:hypothetical protein HAX54_041336 [Datura stramonium]|uniref:Osmotin-like protein n=1 Tax=Datura stramonium TaxID=4076 RepID=A0ABS8SL87_DATST|nr:hypothetical protein [Datura stramonium]
MSHLTTCSVLPPLAFVTYTYASGVFEVHNNCPYTVWAACIGGRRLGWNPSWWFLGPTSFDGAGRGGCIRQSDCGGVLECKGEGRPPNTLAEYALNQFSNLDFWDISVIDGFNIPMSFGPTKLGQKNVMEFNARPI